jgi:hypothetical protein
MREVIDGIYHWTARHDPIGSDVSSYFVASSGAIIDPKLPDGGFEALPEEPKVVVLTSGHHHRDAGRIARQYGIPVRGLESAAEHIGSDLEIDVVEDGGEAADGVTLVQIGALAPDEGVAHVAVGPGALVFADGVMRHGGDLAFPPDKLIGDDPEQVKLELQDAYTKLLPRDFDVLLFAHGDPIASGGKERLRDWLAGDG